jgi:ribonuclease J
MIDGKGIGDVGSSILRQRRKLSEEGLVVVTLAFDADTGYIIYGPDIVSLGFVFELELGHLLEEAKCVILDVVEEMGPDVDQRLDKIRLGIQNGLRKFFSYAIKRQPVILCFAMEV